ncbi:MAG: hypothetical protein NC517_12040 [Firmicutes bacterium]|nr:hypothetical protein [Bacillota bacterium]
MADITYLIDEAEVKRRLGLLADKSGLVISRAANRSYITGKNAIAKAARQDYLITQRDVNNPKALKITKARPTEPTVTLGYTGNHRNLYLWNNKKAVSSNKIIHWSHGKPNVKVYRAAVARGHAKIKLLGDNKPFIQKVKKDDFVGLFRRESRKRDSRLVSVQAPAIPQILKNEDVMEQFRRAAGPMMEKRLEHEIDAVLKGVVR